MLLANAVVGFWEEYQAGNAIAALKAKLAIRARVLREGKWTMLAARELVPGDVIRLRLGDIVPGDARLLEGDQVEVDQSALTGESLPVTRKANVLLALLNDGAILSIAYDNVHYTNKPETWNLHIVLGIATVLGMAGVIASFGLFYLGERVFHFNREFIRSLIYLKLSVAGHLTIFVTRTRGPFWSIRPARILLSAVIGTQLIATVFAVYGILMTPIGWGWGLAVWGYALVWFLVNDRVKLAAYKIFDPAEPALLSGKPLDMTRI